MLFVSFLSVNMLCGLNSPHAVYTVYIFNNVQRKGGYFIVRLCDKNFLLNFLNIPYCLPGQSQISERVMDNRTSPTQRLFPKPTPTSSLDLKVPLNSSSTMPLSSHIPNIHIILFVHIFDRSSPNCQVAIE